MESNSHTGGGSVSSADGVVVLVQRRSASAGPLHMGNGAPVATVTRRSSPPLPTRCSGVASSHEQPVQSTVRSSNGTTPSPVPTGNTPRKIMSKNANNTTFPTSIPSNLAELQLFRVMQNASLLQYFETLLEMGGDDVQQICDAGEEEFLEIMALVGMASKPLHVRRLQKSLQEWVSSGGGGRFRAPLVAGDDFEVVHHQQSGSVTVVHHQSAPIVTSQFDSLLTGRSDSGRLVATATGAPGGYYSVDSGDSSRSVYSPSPADTLSSSPGLVATKRPYSPLDNPSCPPSSSSSPGSGGGGGGSTSGGNAMQITPVLVEAQIAKLAAAAERLSKHLPQLEPKPQNAKRKMSKELDLVMSMPDAEPRRMEEIRRYAAIYGRFDCKRRPEKRLTMHEVSVNEAAAQICRFLPALLTRRDELFPLARQVVKDSGCQYTKTHSMYLGRTSDEHHSTADLTLTTGSGGLYRSGCTGSSPTPVMTVGTGGVKRPRNDEPSTVEMTDCDGQNQQSVVSSPKRQEMNNDDSTSRSTSSIHILFQNKLRDRSSSVEDDDVDSNYSLSNSSSPSHQMITYENESHPYLCDNNSIRPDVQGNGSDINNRNFDDSTITNINSPRDLQVISACGDNIIAVANPALAMSTALIALTGSTSSSSDSTKHNTQQSETNIKYENNT